MYMYNAFLCALWMFSSPMTIHPVHEVRFILIHILTVPHLSLTYFTHRNETCFCFDTSGKACSCRAGSHPGIICSVFV